MSAAYSSSFRTYLPHVLIVFDRFHVTKLLNDTIDKIRRAEYAKRKDNGLNVLKGQRFLLLRNFVDLDDSQKSSLQYLLEINQPLAIPHSMKEQFRLFLGSVCSRAEGWIIQAVESGVE